MRIFWSCGLGLAGILLCGSTARAQGKKGASGAASSASQTNPTSTPASSSAAFESQMLAFGGLDIIAANIAKNACAAGGMSDTPTVIIFDQTSFATLQSYEAFVANAKTIVGAYSTLVTDQSAIAALKATYARRAQQSKDKNEAAAWKSKEHLFGAAGPTLGDPISDATALLSAIAISSNTESAGSITIPDSAMAVALTRALNATDGCRGRSVIYPPLFGLGSSSDVSSADIQADIQEVDDVRRIAHDDVSKRNTEYIAAHPAAPATAAVPATPGSPAIPAKPATPGPGDTVLTGALTDVNGLYDSFMNSLLQVNSSTGVVGAASVVQGRQLATLIAGKAATDDSPEVKPAFLLLASIVTAGGTTHDHKTFWTALTTGDKFTYSGGAVVNVALWKAAGTVPAYVDIIRYRSPLMKIENPSSVAGVASGDNLK
jgi:hypothetical protein